MTWQRDLQQTFSTMRFLIDEPMCDHTYFGIGGPADALVRPACPRSLASLIKWCYETGVPYHVIGNGTNLLVLDKGVRGLLIIVGQNLSAIKVGSPLLIAQAGALLSQIADKAASHSLKGLEFAAGIPGTLGGALIMNAGAYGGEMKDVIIGARIITEAGEVESWDVHQLALSYRHSAVIDAKATVLSVTLQLRKGHEKTIREKVAFLNKMRRDKQPLTMPSAGSTFKRTPGIPASLLIDQAGLKGVRVGGAQVSPKHAGFIVNTGGATAQDVLDLMAHVQAVVQQKYGVILEPEVRIIGER